MNSGGAGSASCARCDGGIPGPLTSVETVLLIRCNPPMMAVVSPDADTVRWIETSDRREGKMVEALVQKVGHSGNGRAGPHNRHVTEINTVFQDGK